jgi:phosphoglycolate phosphatase
LRNTGIESLFSAVHGTPEDGSLDDKSELVKRLVSMENLKLHNSVLIGDRREDIIAARSSQLTSIGALWGYGSISELQQAGALLLAETPEHLTVLLPGILLS